MKRPKFITLLLFCAACFLLASCEEEPIASFTVSETIIYTGQSVTFNNTTQDADHYEWFFGDGTSSTDASPSHTYTQMGAYYVTLIAYSKSGRQKDDAYHQYIFVLDPTTLTIQVNMDGSPLNGCNVVLFDNYTNWYNDQGSVANATTNSSGRVTFTGCSKKVYYADFYYNSTYRGTLVTEELTLFQDNFYTVNLYNKQLTFNNPTFTPITIDVQGFATRIIPAGGSTTYQVSGNSVSFNAVTNGTLSGSAVGLGFTWNTSVSTTASSSTYTFNISSSYFYLHITNNSGVSFYPNYTNYGSSTYQLVFYTPIPSNNTKLGVGYHHARYNTEIRFYKNGTSYYVYAISGTHFTFPNTNNQQIWLTASKSSVDQKDPQDGVRKLFRETPETISLLPTSVFEN